jgi:iron complex outermembrane recepter protein
MRLVGGYAILPATKTNSKALFWIEEGRWGALQANLGLRYDNAQNQQLQLRELDSIDDGAIR